MTQFLSSSTIAILEANLADRLLDWCKQQDFEKEIFNDIKTPRRIAWFGMGVRFRRECIPFRAKSTIEEHSLLDDLRHSFYREADSVLLYHYSPGVGIGEHRDKGFEPRVVLINLLDCPRNLFGKKDARAHFVWGRNNYWFADGEIFVFDSSKTHEAKGCSCNRYSLQFRKITGGHNG